MILCMGICSTYVCMYIEVRGQLGSFGSLFVGSRDWIQVSRLVYHLLLMLLSHQLDPVTIFLNLRFLIENCTNIHLEFDYKILRTVKRA